jgi:peptidyl-prolyl cis-trans isomerase D
MALMNRMRENMKLILMILVFAFILTIVFSWGMGGFKRDQPKGIIASVDGQEITYQEYSSLYQQEMRSQRERTGSDPEGYQLQQVENGVYENLIQQRLLKKVVDQIGLDATDEEILEEIHNNPPSFLRSNEAFLDSTGKFDINKYQDALQNPSANWTPIENYVRQMLPYQKLDQLLRNSVVVTDDDAKLEYIKNNVKVKLHFLLYDASAFTQSVTEPTDVEIAKYYKDNSKEFHDDEKRVLDYVMLETKPTKADTQATYTQANELVQDANKGSDFAKLAELYSQDKGSAANGGDVGYFAKGQMVKPFEDAAFGAKIGEIVGPIQSQFGLHIIKVEDQKKENGELKVKARHILLNFEASPATREALREEANYIAEMAKNANLDTVAKAEGFQGQKTRPFTMEGYIGGIGMERRVNYFTFRNKVGTITTDPFQLDKGFLVARVAEIIPEQIRPLNDVKSQITEKLKTQKRMEMAKEKAQAGFDKLAGGTTLDEIAQQDGLSLGETDFFTMASPASQIDREPEVIGAAVAKKIGEYAGPIEATRGYFIVQVIDKKEFDDQDFQAKKEDLKRQLAASRQSQIYGKWYTALKEKSKIKDFRVDYL